MRLRREGTTALIITHRQRLLQQVDRILVLNDGQVVSLAAPTREPPVARAVAGNGQQARSTGVQRVTKLKPSARGRHEGGEESAS